MKRTFLLLILAVLSLPSFAQEKDSIKFKCRYIDSFTWEAAEGAKVTVYDADSTTVLCDSVESLIVIANNVRHLVGYIARLPQRPYYVLKFTKKGYYPLITRVHVPERQYGRKVREWDTGDIKVRKNYEEEDNAKDLGEATVTASRVAMVVRGDTIVYDARAFRLAEGSMLDNLIRALPGAKLSENGVITINGKYVDNLLINGRDFFKGDPKVALDNLPAYTVNEIKVYHKEKDGAYLDEQRDKEKDPYVLDVRLKREYSRTWLANFEVAGGSKTKGDFDPVYLGRAFAMRITDHSSIGMYGSINNLGDNQSPGRRGEWKKMDVTQGERTLKTGGVNVNVEAKQGYSFDLALTANQETSDMVSGTDGVNYYPSGDVISRSRHDQRQDRTEVNFRTSFSKPWKKAYLSTTALLRYSHDKSQGFTNAVSRDAEQSDTLYSRQLRTRSGSDYWWARYYCDLRFQSPLSGRNMQVGWMAEYSHRDASLTTGDLLRYPHTSATQLRKDILPSNYYLYSISLQRDLFTYGDSFSPKNGGGLFSYSYNQTYNSGERRRSAIDTMLNVLPSVIETGNLQIDERNSFHTMELKRRHTLHSWFNFAFSGGYRISFNLDLQFIKRSIRDVRNATPLSLTRKDVVFTPNLEVTLHNYTRFNWSIGKDQPSMLHLLGVRDQRDPLSLQTGNPNLQNTTHHNLSLGYRRSLTKHQQNVGFNIYYRLSTDAVGMARTYDRTTGVTTTRPMNINGNWNSGVSLDYGRALDKKRKLMLSTSSVFHFMHSVDFSADTRESETPLRSGVDNYRFKETLSLTYAIRNVRLKGQASVDYTRQTSDRTGFMNGNYTDFQYGLSLSTPLVWGIDLETDLMAYARRGYNDPSMNTTDWVWNASLSRALGKKKQWLVRAVGFDLLHQLSSVKRYVTAQGTTETWYNTVPAYATLHLIYRLHIKPKKERKK